MLKGKKGAAKEAKKNRDIIIRETESDESEEEIVKPEDRDSIPPKLHKKTTKVDKEIEHSEQSDSLVIEIVSKTEEPPDTDEEGSDEESISSARKCCATFFCSCLKRSTHSDHRGVRRKSPEDEYTYRHNCRRENGFNGWSAFSSLPVNATGLLADRAVVPTDSSAVPVSAFINTLRSLIAVGVNIYFLFSKGDHSTGSRWSAFINSLIFVMSLSLFVLSLVAVGIEQEQEDASTKKLILSIIINCLIAGIAFAQSSELGYHQYNQVSGQPKVEEFDLEKGLDHKPEF